MKTTCIFNKRKTSPWVFFHLFKNSHSAHFRKLQKAFKAFIKPFETPQKSVEKKFSVNFFSLSSTGAKRVKLYKWYQVVWSITNKILKYWIKSYLYSSQAFHEVRRRWGYEILSPLHNFQTATGWDTKFCTIKINNNLNMLTPLNSLWRHHFGNKGIIKLKVFEKLWKTVFWKRLL